MVRSGDPTDGGSTIGQLVDRLVAQFASPYDFVRELVQNGMDAGSDLIEVTLDAHVLSGDHRLFELSVIDTGAGMDEAIIDSQLTRLFSSSKTDDRTMAGGFGIGFVSVFAWEPDIVVLQTGRGGEAWELLFFADRSFEKHRLDEPCEGTLVRLFRRGRATDGSAIAEAIRDSLWRWCRYCPIEITFEDLSSGEGIEEIHDTPLPNDVAATVSCSEATTEIRVAFAVPPRTVLLRRGLVVVEGASADVLKRLSGVLGPSVQHLCVWADSPNLRPTLARDALVDDSGLAAVESEIVAAVSRLRDVLVERLQRLAESDVSWSDAVAQEYRYLHHHLACELDAMPEHIASRPIVRLYPHGAASPRQLQARARAGVVAVVPTGYGADERLAGVLAAGIPVVAASGPDLEWLNGLLSRQRLVALPLSAAVSSVEAADEEPTSLCALAQLVLRRAGIDVGGLVMAELPDGSELPLLGGRVGESIAVIGGPNPRDFFVGRDVLVDRRHPLIRTIVDLWVREPQYATLALALVVARRLSGELAVVEAVADAMKAVSP